MLSALEGRYRHLHVRVSPGATRATKGVRGAPSQRKLRLAARLPIGSVPVTPFADTRISSSMPLNICVLSPLETEAFETTGVRPNCSRHRHITRKSADQLIEDSVVPISQMGNDTPLRIRTVRWVGEGKNRIVFETGRTWRKVVSGGTPVMQLVKGGAFWPEPSRRTPSGRSGPVRTLTLETAGGGTW